ncbi:PLP-dependent transferase [Atractiella rhizophila]|nr:PLP-dependent transferase [Atractiella rhizophila]
MQVCQLAREWTRECRHQSFISMNGLFAGQFKPRVIMCGASAYPHDWEHERLRKIADSEGHIFPVSSRPFQYCDVDCTTTHKTLRGPRAGSIFFRKDKDPEIERCVNEATIAAVAVALRQASTPEFREYASQIIKNTNVLGNTLTAQGYKLQRDGSDNPLIL